MPTTRTGSKSKTQTAAVEDSNVVNKIGDDTPPWGTEPAEEKKRYKPKAFKPDQMVTVRNGFQGELLYKSKKSSRAPKAPARSSSLTTGSCLMTLRLSIILAYPSTTSML